MGVDIVSRLQELPILRRVSATWSSSRGRRFSILVHASVLVSSRGVASPTSTESAESRPQVGLLDLGKLTINVDCFRAQNVVQPYAGQLTNQS